MEAEMEKTKITIQFSIRIPGKTLPELGISQEIEYWFNIKKGKWESKSDLGKPIFADSLNELYIMFLRNHRFLNFV
jgi:hypothetical protein